MKRKELTANIESYQNAKSRLSYIYSDLDRRIENNKPADDLIESGAAIENNISEHGPTLAAAICAFIKKDYINDFHLNYSLDDVVMYDGVEKSLIDWGFTALMPSAIRPRFSDKTVEIVGPGNPGEYIEILTENLLNALKGLRVTHTVNITLFGESIKLGTSGLKEMLKLTGDKIRLVIDHETKYLIINDAGSTFTVKPWAWDRAKGKTEYERSRKDNPGEFFGIYDHNRKIQLTSI